MTSLPAVAEGGKALKITGMFGDPEKSVSLSRPMTIAEIVADFGFTSRLPTIAVLNGEPVLRGQWSTSVVAANDTVAFVAVPGGGGGGSNQGKQIMGLVAALALSVAAPFVGSMVAGTLFGGSAIAASLASAAFIAGGPLSLKMLEPAL